nr:immunoglobulin heavy chain junction region [Mus musculus]
CAREGYDYDAFDYW